MSKRLSGSISATTWMQCVFPMGIASNQRRLCVQHKKRLATPATIFVQSLISYRNLNVRSGRCMNSLSWEKRLEALSGWNATRRSLTGYYPSFKCSARAISITQQAKPCVSTLQKKGQSEMHTDLSMKPNINGLLAHAQRKSE